MASVTHQALLMIGGTAATAPPGGGWFAPLSTVASSVARDRFLQARADASSYANNWLHPIAAVVTVVNFGWTNRLATVAPRTRDTRLIDPSSYANAWLSPATAKDPFFSSVVLLLGFPGADASTSVTDESTANNKGVAVASGNAQVDTAQSKFGGSSLLLDGSGDLLRWVDSPDYNLAAGSFTIECWIRPATIAAGTRFIVGQWFTAGDLGWVLYQFAGQLWFNVSVTGSDNFSDVGSATLLSANTWYAVAIDFDGSKYRLYLDGVIVASSTTLRTIHDSSFDLAIGSNSLGSGFFFNGWIDEVRITKNVARYASDSGYTPATAAFPRS